jgi:hypothetical protein
MHPHSLLFFRGGPVLVHIENGLSTCPIYTVLLFESFIEIPVADIKPGSFSNTKVSETYQ